MPTTTELSVTTQLQGDKWVITAVVLPGGFLPQSIFMYENTGTDKLGEYSGVCDKDDLVRLREWTGAPLAKFGNRFVKYNQAKIIIDAMTSDQTPQVVVNRLINSVKYLNTALQASENTTQIITI